MKTVLSVIVPVFNEEEVLEATYRRLTDVLSFLGDGASYEIIFVNDGSRDRTAEILEKLHKTDERVKAVMFSRNFGQQAALTAGMEYSTGDAVVIIDADLQDPPELIPKMLEKWREGYDVVYGKRVKRLGETAFKKLTSSLYYRLLRSLTNVDIPVDTGEFRLIDRKVCDVLSGLRESNRYIRGLVSWVGFKQCALEFVREERFAGETKYSLKKMIKLSIDGVTAFSYKPLKLAALLGLPASAAGFVWLVVLLCRYLFVGAATEGWVVVIAMLLFFQGIVLTMLGILGEYVGRMFEDVKGRPAFIVREAVGFNDTKTDN